MNRLITGVGVALAVSYPAVVLGAIMLAVDDRNVGLLPVPRTILLLVIFAGPVVGGAFVARRGATGIATASVGAIALFLVGAFGVLRQAVGDDEVNLAFLVVFPALGAVFGLVGGAVAEARAARRRS